MTSATLAQSFVKTSGSHFSLDGSKFYFEGTNAYYLMTSSNSDIDAVFQAAGTANLPVVRTWLFNSGSDSVWFQKWDSSSGKMIINDDSTTGLGRIDYVIQAAAKNNIKLIFSLTNNWKDYGGMDYYVQSFGGSHHDDFYTNSDIVNSYKAYIDHVLNRQNNLTGTAYKDDPTIFGWELANEPRCDGSGSYPRSSSCGTETITKWADNISSYIKSIDSNHLVAVGDEGFFNTDSSDWAYNGYSGVDFAALIALSNIDFGTFHLYPEDWSEDKDAWAIQYIKDHITSQDKIGKPVIMEEYGLSTSADRGSLYPKWQKTVEDGELAADAFWQLSVPCNPNLDHFALCTSDSDFDTVVENHANAMAAKNT
ncbi:glycoside hydrolase superfamily [Dichotomocladium elegans]|nr:glycoside hydrolase superfamily [Dichotomocladium elegans]